MTTGSTMKNKIMALTIMLLLPIWISACSYDYHIKDEGIVAEQRELFNKLCNAKDRSIIYQTAKAGGYLSASRGVSSCLEGWDPIFKYGYQYAECTTAKVKSHVLPDDADIYRFTLETEGHPDCGTGEKHFSDYSRRTYRGNDPAEKCDGLGFGKSPPAVNYCQVEHAYRHTPIKIGRIR